MEVEHELGGNRLEVVGVSQHRLWQVRQLHVSCLRDAAAGGALPYNFVCGSMHIQAR